ncbi:MAG TPA: 30S ribosomal protein S20 [Methylomirabilota bacterium]|nr:30S ribosomal protein S20 [Methylomirabilota bacterium]
MANTRSARKRIKQNEKRRLRNRAIRSQVRSAVKDARVVEAGKGAEAREAIREAIRTIDKAVSRGILHRNTAARRKSALARRLPLVK